MNNPAEVPVLLLVDDEPAILSALRRLLRPEGYTLHLAESGRAGLELLEREKVDLVISDMRMPEMDGVETLRQLRRRWPGLPVVLVSGDDLGADWPFYQQAGADAHLLKPLDVDVLSALLQRRLR